MGTIVETETGWETKGVFTKNGNKIEITELPIGVSTDKYTEHLNKLSESGKIVRFNVGVSATDENAIHFVLQVPPSFDTSLLKMTKTVTKSCLNLLTPTGTVCTFASTGGILAEFFVCRMRVYAKRRRHLIHSYEGELTYISAKLKFVKAVLDNKIDIRKTKQEILEQACNEGLVMKLAEEFMKMPLISLSQEMVEAMEKKWEQFQLQLEETRKMSPKDFYKKDLNQLMCTKKRKRNE